MKIPKFENLKLKIGNFKKGITPIELLVVIAVLAVIVAIVLPQFSKIREEQVLKGAVSDALSVLNKARIDTLSSYNSSEYGVYFGPDEIVLFKGTSFSPGSADNESVPIVLPAHISNVAFAGASSSEGSIYFNRLSGSPSATGTVTISTPSYSKVVTINASGAASVD